MKRNEILQAIIDGKEFEIVLSTGKTIPYTENILIYIASRLNTVDFPEIRIKEPVEKYYAVTWPSTDKLRHNTSLWYHNLDTLIANAYLVRESAKLVWLEMTKKGDNIISIMRISSPVAQQQAHNQSIKING